MTTAPAIQRLQRWHQQLRQPSPQLTHHLEAARGALCRDPIAPLRQQALTLLGRLAAAAPGEGELALLGRLHRTWGDLWAIDAPAIARHHYEEAWSCGSDAALEQRLADLAWRQGWQVGAHALAQPSADLPPWQQLPCAGLGCGSCQEALQGHPEGAPQVDRLELTALPGGRTWCERSNPWAETYGIAVADAGGRLQVEHTRSYPWSWPGCRYGTEAAQELSLAQLSWRQRHLPEPTWLDGAVLAVADLSAELHYHWQLELLPRLGLAWQQLQHEEPGLRLWHNGGASPRVREALHRLGIPQERILHAQHWPHIQAEQLWLASWPSPFAAPGPWAIGWLRDFWALEPPSRAAAHTVLWLPRGEVTRRPMLEEQACIAALAEPLRRRGQDLVVCRGGTMQEQLQRCADAQQVVAPHGGAMANLLAVAPGSRVLELVNPAYAPPYLATTLAALGAVRQGWPAQPTSDPLATLLYAGPLEFPIDPGPLDTTIPALLEALDP
ncbi:MAG: glycosyltransferase family 61 protein [Cyanobacteriota bacterium]